MTGFGAATIETPELRVAVEVKSLNSKFLDVFCRIPKNLSSFELEVRNYLTQLLERGKVECTITVQGGTAELGVSCLNRTQVKAYLDDITSTAQQLGMEPNSTELLKVVLQLPNAYTTTGINEAQHKQTLTLVKQALVQATAECDAFRLQEGSATATKLTAYVHAIGSLLQRVEEQDIHRLPALRDRLQKSVRELITDESMDRNRFEQELIYYSEKLDISEEKMRLKHHLTYFLESLNTADSNGKKLNFIAQEIGREINTIGSKANDAGIQRLVVEMKDELEKIKEQTLNLL